MVGGIFSAAALISPANLANGQRKEEGEKTLSQKNANMGGGKVSIKCGKSWCICARAFLKSPPFFASEGNQESELEREKTFAICLDMYILSSSSQYLDKGGEERLTGAASQ